MSPWTIEVLDEVVEAELAAWPTPLRASLTRIPDRVVSVGLERMGEPFVKHVEGKVWEMRASARGNEGRALYVAVTGRRVVILHAFEKKTRATPRRAIDLALARAKRIEPW